MLNLFSKKVCLLIVAFAMIALPVFAQQIGDFNNDGKVDFSEARVTLIAPEQPPPGAGDFDDNRTVNIADFLLFVAAFGARSGNVNFNPLMDMKKDSKIDIADFLAFVAVFGTTCG